MIKKLALLSLAALLALLLGACSNSGAESNPESAVISADTPSLDTTTHTILNWDVSLNTYEITEGLSDSQAMELYGGDTLDVELSEQAKPGHVFVLLDMTIAKTATGQSQFSWENASLVDAEGNHYARHENDTFLTTFGLPRIKSTDLVFGKNEGYVCFEIPQSAADDTLAFVYTNGDEQLSIAIK